ncbi:peptidylprolyl isomerase [Campylobacter sp. MG1]|uniref:peptidylprolyl isomerase n=1 Tax=Campylobacter sp. MG1 TaxID=2976332 RepID=UPI00226CB54F|nr:peptidylprolyl isomerase [Campylobacter sp. MG1]
MKKISLVLAGLLCGVSLNAAVVATFKGGEVTTEELAPYLAQFQISDVNALPKEAKEGLIKDVVTKKLFAKEAEKLKLDKDDAFKSALNSAKEVLLAQQYLLKKFNDIKVSDAEITDYYNKHLNDFKVPEAVKTKHILVKTEAEARDIIKQLKGLKDDALVNKFSELAKTKSNDKGSGAMGGDLPYMSVNELVPEYFNAAKKLKKGEISEPVKSQFGFHVILGEDYKASRQGSLQEAKPFIENGLKNEKHKALVKQEADKLINGAGLQVK